MDRKFKSRSEEELMEAISEKAASYVPEWHLDRENPDIGAALARVYARMQSGTERKYERLPEKFRTDLFNCLNTSMKPSAPARGYAVFGISDPQAGGTELPAGTALRTEVLDGFGERIPVETEEDVFVSPDSLKAIYECSDEDDYIGSYLDDEGNRREIPLFCQKTENLQEHVFYLGHPFLLSMRSYGRLSLSFYERKGVAVSEHIRKAFASSENAVFFYLSEGQKIPFEQVQAVGCEIVLEKKKDSPPWESCSLGGMEGFWLGCRILNKSVFRQFSFEEAYLSSECPAMEPDLIYADGAEKRGGALFAFGERPSIYGELYFASDEVFMKKGAAVELTFEQEFARIPIDAPLEPDPMKWKLVMPKNDVRQEKEYEITIEEVVWEYYNGRGWAGLPVDSSCARLFHVDGGGYRKLKTVDFICPMDMEPVLVGALESRYIRARIVKVNNAFKTNGFYMSPVLSGVSLRYRYPKNVFTPLWFYTVNNLEEQFFRADRCLGGMKSFLPVRGTGENESVLCLGFEKKMEQGPVRMLLVMEHDFEKKRPRLSWEYFGGGRWKELRPVDGTENLARTGTVTFQGIPDAELLSICGRTLYWIRIRDRDKAAKKSGGQAPVIRNIFMNAAKIITVRKGIRETFTMEGFRSQTSFKLLNRNIHTLEVWVLENRLYSEEERTAFLKEGRLLEVRDESGVLAETWVRWKETDSFFYHGPTDRCYTLDANEGIITFGGGLHGAIPAPQVPDGIRMEYSVGGGFDCNLLPGQISGLELSAGFISTAFNPLALSGGYGRETAKKAMERAGRELRHRFRAVTAEDYISLAMEATGNIEKAACFSGLDGDGEALPGAVTMVILKKDYQSGGPFFGDIRKAIHGYLKDKMPVGTEPSGGLYIREPLFVEIELLVTAEVLDYQDIFRVRREIDEVLKGFLDPVTGNFNKNGWEIGSLPDQMQLETAVKKIEGLVSLKRFVAFAFLRGEPGRPRTELEEIRKHPYVLPLSGRHKIEIQVS